MGDALHFRSCQYHMWLTRKACNSDGLLRCFVRLEVSEFIHMMCLTVWLKKIQLWWSHVNNTLRRSIVIYYNSVFFSIAHAPPRCFRYNLTQSVDGSRYMVTKLIVNKIWYKIFYIIGCEMAISFIIPFVLLQFLSVRLIGALRQARKQTLDLHGGSRVDTRGT